MDYILHNLPSKPQVEILLLLLDTKPCPEPPFTALHKATENESSKGTTEVRTVHGAWREFTTVKFA